jgi:hypothetical protein
MYESWSAFQLEFAGWSANFSLLGYLPNKPAFVHFFSKGQQNKFFTKIGPFKIS